ncbi:MAG: DUF309 domain-containing protein [Elusimicrobia bacterium]|nr:DUF309 domain-containing protein [Elusimicrobiota bacterium]
MSHWLARADELGAQGLYFEAHEELETPWRAAVGMERLALQGLIQVAAGLHRLRLNPDKPEGAFYLLDRGRAKLRASRGLFDSVALAALERRLKAIRAAGKAPKGLRFGLIASRPRSFGRGTDALRKGS